MRRCGWWGMIAVCAVMVGCSSAAGGTATPTTSTGGGGSASSGPLFGTTLTAASTGTAVTATISPADGGTLSLKGADGSTYVLTVPGGAVAAPTKITGAVLEDVKGVNGAVTAQAVQFAPEGLQFEVPAVLEIHPAGDVAVDHQLAFTASGDGSQPAAGIVDPTADSMRMLVFHFSLGGWAELKQRFTDWVAPAKPTTATIPDAERKLIAELAGLSQTARVPHAVVPVEAVDDFNTYWDEQVAPTVAAAARDCPGATAAFGVQMRYMQTLRHVFGSRTPPSSIHVMSPAQVQAAWESVLAQCEPIYKEKCQAASDPNILLDFWGQMGALHRAAGMGGDPFASLHTPAKAKAICVKEKWSVEGSGSGASFSGTIEGGLGEPFKVEITLDQGGGGVLSVIPTSEAAGTVTEASTSNGFSSVGTGSYTISGADTGTALMVVKLRTCLTSASKQCRSYSINLTLRRLDP